jgi:hypothetical protein
MLIRSPELKIDRLGDPVILSLEHAIDWVRREKPILWLGSIVSVPEPANFPSGFAITKSLIGKVLAGAVPEDSRQSIVDGLAHLWPLEAVLDEFEFLGFDLSESMLAFLDKSNRSALPTRLHEAAVRYYESGLSKIPLCVTTNWDTLLETSFRAHGFKTIVSGPGTPMDDAIGKPSTHPEEIFIYHSHGSFEAKDVVCSFRQQQSQLTLNTNIFQPPTLFLGYSGYEPSLYTYLEHNAGKGQLWCIRSLDDLQNPAKRRLLCRPNTFVYVGDMCELLTGLGVLDQAVDTASHYVGLNELPSKIVEVVLTNMLCSLNPDLAVNMVSHLLLAFPEEPEGTLRYTGMMRAIINHVRDRVHSPALGVALMAAAKLRDSEQTWISVLGYLLRHDRNVPQHVVRRVLQFAATAPSSGLGREDSPEDLLVYGLGIVKQRANIYKSFVREGERISDWRIYFMTPLLSADLAAMGESCEIWAFEKIRDGDLDSAANLFDYAATSFYLRGMVNAGALNEWATKNVEKLTEIAKGNSLIFPVQEEFGRR